MIGYCEKKKRVRKSKEEEGRLIKDGEQQEKSTIVNNTSHPTVQQTL